MFVKLNTDDSFHKDENNIGEGGVLRDHRGQGLVGFFSFESSGSSFLATVRAMKDGLDLTWN